MFKGHSAVFSNSFNVGMYTLKPEMVRLLLYTVH